MYVPTTANLLEAFENNQSGRTIPSCTVNTVRLGNGNIALLSYDWARIAEITSSGDVMVYEGHYGTSKTTDNHINRVKDYFDNYETLSANPVDGNVPKTFEYTGNYISGFDTLSPIESTARENVRSTMRRRLKNRR
jgi:hypothetical protein